MLLQNVGLEVLEGSWRGRSLQSVDGDDKILTMTMAVGGLHGVY